MRNYCRSCGTVAEPSATSCDYCASNDMAATHQLDCPVPSKFKHLGDHPLFLILEVLSSNSAVWHSEIKQIDKSLGDIRALDKKRSPALFSSAQEEYVQGWLELCRAIAEMAPDSDINASDMMLIFDEPERLLLAKKGYVDSLFYIDYLQTDSVRNGGGCETMCVNGMELSYYSIEAKLIELMDARLQVVDDENAEARVRTTVSSLISERHRRTKYLKHLFARNPDGYAKLFNDDVKEIERVFSVDHREGLERLDAALFDHNSPDSSLRKADTQFVPSLDLPLLSSPNHHDQKPEKAETSHSSNNALVDVAQIGVLLLVCAGLLKWIGLW